MVFSIHFAVALAGSVALFWLFFLAAGEESTSAPFGLVFVALTAGVLAQFLSPWSTPLVLYLYLLGCLREHAAASSGADAAGRNADALR
jgi:hypothetical protein